MYYNVFLLQILWLLSCGWLRSPSDIFWQPKINPCLLFNSLRLPSSFSFLFFALLLLFPRNLLKGTDSIPTFHCNYRNYHKAGSNYLQEPICRMNYPSQDTSCTKYQLAMNIQWLQDTPRPPVPSPGHTQTFSTPSKSCPLRRRWAAKRAAREGRLEVACNEWPTVSIDRRGKICPWLGYAQSTVMSVWKLASQQTAQASWYPAHTHW